MIVFYVQGGGLGHLTRTHKLIQQLRIDSNELLIISPSQFKHHFNQYQFITLSWRDAPEIWSQTLIKQLSHPKIQCCYIDAFPLGIKGELISVYKALPNISFIYTCRILKWKKYRNAMPDAFTPKFTKTLLLETIYDDHLEWIKLTSANLEIVHLPFTSSEKQEKLTKEPYGLVIHSGGKNDVLVLCDKIKAVIKDAAMPLFVFSQVSVDFSDERFKLRTQEHPVQQYFEHATHIYTAAGFNLMHELTPYKEKHTAFPIERLFDDQFFRAKNSVSLHLK